MYSSNCRRTYRITTRQHNPFGFHRAHLSLRYVLDKIFLVDLEAIRSSTFVLNRWGEKEFSFSLSIGECPIRLSDQNGRSSCPSRSESTLFLQSFSLSECLGHCQ